MLKSRFEVFAAVSFAIHAGLFAAAVHRTSSRASGAGEGGAAPGQAAAAVAGQTFEVPDLEQADDEESATGEIAPVELDERPAVAPPQTMDGLVPPRPTHASKGAAKTGTGALPAAAPVLYGAVGDRSAGDLVATFKRTFPLAASTDPLWDRVPVGFYAEGDATFFLADDGSLTRGTISASAAPAFRAAIARTTTMMKHRLFTARGATTHLHMIVRVSDRLVNHGAFTIDAAGSFELPSGKHVSVSITER